MLEGGEPEVDSEEERELQKRLKHESYCSRKIVYRGTCLCRWRHLEAEHANKTKGEEKKNLLKNNIPNPLKLKPKLFD